MRGIDAGCCSDALYPGLCVWLMVNADRLYAAGLAALLVWLMWKCRRPDETW